MTGAGENGAGENGAGIDNGRERDSLSRSALLTDPEIRAFLEREKLDALAEFAAGAGHEINNPLAIIGGHAQLLLGEIDHPAHKRHLAVILAQVKRAYEMIADVRLYARPPIPSPERFDPTAWLNEFLDTWRERYPDWPGTVTETFDPLPDTFVSDRAVWGTILDALLKNAVEALGRRSDGRIFLFAEAVSPDRIRIVAEDNGPGVAESIRPLIFSPYFSGRASGRGLGFGLPKADALVRTLGGTLELAAPQKSPTGCRFVLMIPTGAKKLKMEN